MINSINGAVVTGATGMIGVALVNELLASGSKVLVLIRPNSKKVLNLPRNKNLTVAECALHNLRAFKSDDKYDVFFHLGWDGTYGDNRNNMYIQTENIVYTIDAVNLASRLGCKVFVGAGSQAEYGRVECKLSGGTPAYPENGYGAAKLAAGIMSRVECRKLKIRHVWSRILSVYGPLDGDQTPIISGITKLLAGEKPSFTKGEQMWDYIYSEDAALALIAMAKNGIDGKIYPIGSGVVRPLKDYIFDMRDGIDKNLPLGLGDIEYMQNQVMYLCADIEELTRDTGFTPKLDFPQGIKKTIDWCRKRGV